jgi:geranylgeranyl transferase type-2 subunit alpha
MHGLLIRDRKELSEQEQAAEQAAACSATGLLQEIIIMKQQRDFSENSFNKSMELLQLNPELSLAWNFRREIIHAKPGEERTSVLRKELDVLNAVMVDLRMTKSYCLWSHRRWIISQLSPVDSDLVQQQLRLVNTILDLDARNFHAWSYRQWLRKEFNLELEDIEYSEKLILKDFSNYSAWFLRSWAVDRGSVVDPHNELDLVWNALFTEPNDQSCWQYHEWLLGRYPELSEKDKEYMSELEGIVEDRDSKYLLLSKLKHVPQEDRHVIKEKLVNIDPMRTGYYRDL